MSIEEKTKERTNNLGSTTYMVLLMIVTKRHDQEKREEKVSVTSTIFLRLFSNSYNTFFTAPFFKQLLHQLTAMANN